MTIKNAELIRAVLDGKTVQYQTTGGVWVDFHDDPAWAINCLSAHHQRNSEFRLKPEPLVRYCAVDSKGGIWGSALVRDASKNLHRPVWKVLRVELDPETLEVLSATTEAP